MMHGSCAGALSHTTPGSSTRTQPGARPACASPAGRCQWTPPAPASPWRGWARQRPPRAREPAVRQHAGSRAQQSGRVPVVCGRARLCACHARGRARARTPRMQLLVTQRQLRQRTDRPRRAHLRLCDCKHALNADGHADCRHVLAAEHANQLVVASACRGSAARAERVRAVLA